MATPNPVTLFLRRNAFSACCVALSVVLGGVALFLAGQRRTLESSLQQRTAEGEEMLALVANGPRLREHHALVHEAVERIDANLVVEDNLAENLGEFYKIEEATGVRLAELRQLNAPPFDDDAPYKVIPYSLQLEGSFERVAHYLFRLETGPRLTRLTSFNLQRRTLAGDAPATGGSGAPGAPGAAANQPAPPSGVGISINLVVLGRP